MALIVVVADTVIGPLYVGDAAVGVLPSVVYLITAPLVPQFMLTVCAPVYIPSAILNVGVATGPSVRLNVSIFKVAPSGISFPKKNTSLASLAVVLAVKFTVILFHSVDTPVELTTFE